MDIIFVNIQMEFENKIIKINIIRVFSFYLVKLDNIIT